MTLTETIREAEKLLKSCNINSYQVDASLILGNIMGVTKEFLISNDKINISENIRKKYNVAIKRRTKGEPVAYINGKKEFWSIDFVINKSTLVPRPETELLLYKVVEIFKDRKINILDIGTGSGCILLSLLKELKFAKGIGIDISSKAIQTAVYNSKRLNLSSRAKFRIFNIKDFNIGKYDLIISNPPYVPLKDIKNLSKDIINFEPIIALKGGFDGLDLIKKIIYKSNNLLKKNGLFVTEIGNNQYLRVASLLKCNGIREIDKEYDYNRNVRCIIGTRL